MSVLPTFTEKKKPMDSVLSNIAFAVFLMILAGACFAIQSGCNATLNKYGGRSFSSLYSFSTGTICCLIFFVVDISTKAVSPPTNHVKSMPWYGWIGGMLGSFCIIVIIIMVPKHGAATVSGIILSAQIITSCFIDHFELVGVAQRTYTVWRILASLGLVGCVFVLSKF